MLFNINKDIMEKWRWTSPRMYILISIIKKYEDKLEKGKLIVFPILDLKKNFGYSSERNITHNSFIKQIKSDISLLDPYNSNGGRLVFGMVKTRDRKNLTDEVYFKYIDSEEEKIESTLKAEVKEPNKNLQPSSPGKYKPFYGPIENDRTKLSAKTITGSEIEIDLNSLPEHVKKQFQDKLNNE